MLQLMWHLNIKPALQKAWEWAKSHWKWLAAAVASLLGFVLLGRNKLTVEAPASVGADVAKAAIQEETTKEIAIVDADRLKQLDAIHEEHAEVIANLDAQQKAKVFELSQNPVQLNSFLLEIGKQQR